MKQKVAKKKNAAKSTSNGGDDKRAQLREDFREKGPLKLRKYAITGLNIPASVVDEWNDFTKMIDFCVAKALDEELPNMDDDSSETFDEDSSEFDAGGLLDDSDETDEGNDDEMDGDGESMFADPEDDEEEEEKPKPAAQKKQKVAKKTKLSAKTAAPPTEDGDLEVQLQGLLDVITNQGVVLDKLTNSAKSMKSTIEEVYVRQEATHKAVTAVAKTIFKVSTYISEFVPRALKAMRFKPETSKDIKSKAEAAANNVEEVIQSLIDPESD